MRQARLRRTSIPCEKFRKRLFSVPTVNFCHSCFEKEEGVLRISPQTLTNRTGS